LARLRSAPTADEKHRLERAIIDFVRGELRGTWLPVDFTLEAVDARNHTIRTTIAGTTLMTDRLSLARDARVWINGDEAGEADLRPGMSVALQLAREGKQPRILGIRANKGAPEKAAAEVDRLVRQLGSPRFGERQAASKALNALGRAAVPALRQATSACDPEVRSRAQRLLQTWESKEATWYCSYSHDAPPNPSLECRIRAADGKLYFINEHGDQTEAAVVLGGSQINVVAWGMRCRLDMDQAGTRILFPNGTLRQGAADYILKPVNMDALRASLARVAQLKEAQEQALKAERLATLGQMVAGIAHESRNALQLIQASVEMLALEVEDRPEALELVACIQGAEDRLHRLFEDIRGYAAPITLERSVYNVAKVWRTAWEQLGKLRGSRPGFLPAEVVTHLVGQDRPQPGPECPLAAPLESADLAEDDQEHVLHQVIAVFELPGVAAVDQWTGANAAVDTNWSDGANWSTGAPPNPGGLETPQRAGPHRRAEAARHARSTGLCSRSPDLSADEVAHLAEAGVVQSASLRTQPPWRRGRPQRRLWDHPSAGPQPLVQPGPQQARQTLQQTPAR
jgi:hypothetical protein